MKRCPTCQKTFDDDKRFCQIDGTPLVADAVEQSEPIDPYKTVIGGQPFTPPSSMPDDPMKTMVVDSKSKDEDLLQIPEVFDPMKTVVVSDPIKKEIPSNQPEPPKFNEPSLSPPSFGDLSSSSSDKGAPKFNEPPKSEPQFLNEPPKVESPFSNEPAKQNSPVSSPFDDAPKSDSPFSSSSNEPKFGSPFSTPNDAPKFDSPFGKENEEKPKNDPFPPFKDSTAPLGEKKDPFQNSAFGLPQIPLEKSYAPPNQTFNPPPVQQNDWNSPPPPVQQNDWQNQDVNVNASFNPPVGAAPEGQNKTLPIISLVCGILSCLCCFSVITGPAAIVMGFIAKGNIEKDPAMYGGRGLALGGMISGAIGTLIGIAVIILQVLGAFAGRF